jgi:hypothetical protein
VPNEFSQYFQMGVAGAMLAWFMFRVTPELQAIRDATNRTTRALLLITLELPESSEAARREARAMLAELDGDKKLKNGGST